MLPESEAEASSPLPSDEQPEPGNSEFADDDVIELGPAAEPVSDEPSPEEKAAIAFESRREILTDNYVACAMTRAKLEASLKHAKKREKDALEDLSDHIDKGPQVMPLFDRKAAENSPTAIAPASTDAPTLSAAFVEPAATVDPDAWKAASIDELQLKAALTERLIEAGLDTIGKLEAFRAEAADHRAKWPKGIGTAKITEIENAVIDWLTKHRDAHLFPSSEVASETAAEATEAADDQSLDATLPTYPTEAEWNALCTSTIWPPRVAT